MNIFRTHQSQYGRRKPEDIDPARCHPAAEVEVPPYHPDTLAVREIWSEYHDRITEADAKVGEILDLLERDGLTDSTIVILLGDNGMGIPAGKVWLWEQGLHVPMIIRVPTSLRDMMNAQTEGVRDDLVSFIDFAPTVLSIAGLPIPEYMSGLPFMGPDTSTERRFAFAARDFHDNADLDTSRAVRAREFHYVRNLMPHIGWDAILYSWDRAPYMLEEWRQQAEAGRVDAGTRRGCFFTTRKPPEELYRVADGEAQLQNLVDDPDYADTLLELRTQCEDWMRDQRDLGLLSQFELYSRSEGDTPYRLAADPARHPIDELLAAAGMHESDDMGGVLCLLGSDDAAIRRWGVLRLSNAGTVTAEAHAGVLRCLEDPAPDVRMAAAESLAAMALAPPGMVEKVLVPLLSHSSRIVRNETLLALARMGEAARPALPHLERALAESKHDAVWSYDNIPHAISMVRAALGVPGAESGPFEYVDYRNARAKYL